MPQVRGAIQEAGFGPGEVEDLFKTISASSIPSLGKKSASEGLVKLLDGRVPQQSELALLENVFGRRFTDSVRSLAKEPGRLRQLSDALNLPRSLAASFDMSAPLRQGLILTVSHPGRASRAFFQMGKDFFSPKNFGAFTEALRSDPMLPLSQASGLHLASLGAAGSLGRAGARGGGEEVFRSTLAESIPLIGRGVKASERAYVGYLDRLRFDVFKDSAKRFEKLGLNPERDAGAFTDLARWINIASGRGSLGKFDRVMGEAGQVFFSPRFMAARLQTFNPMTYVRMHPAVRKQAAKELVALGGAGMGVTALGKAAGAEVELDPRSTDFGKLRYGHTRIDPSGGFQPYVRLLAQLAGGHETLYQRKGGRITEVGPAWKTGVRKTLGGELKPLTGEGPFAESRATVIGRFARGKLSPQAGLVADFFMGHNMLGDPLEWGPNVAAAVERGAPREEVFREVTKTKEWELFVPMFLQDVSEAMQQEGLIGAALAASSFFGGGVGSYVTPEEAFARTRRKAHLIGVDPADLLYERRVGR